MVAVLQLCAVERAALQAGLAPLLSPEVALTLVWFLRRWGLTYLLPNESYYSQVSIHPNAWNGPFTLWRLIL